jgi:hypothetical protein
MATKVDEIVVTTPVGAAGAKAHRILVENETVLRPTTFLAYTLNV